MLSVIFAMFSLCWQWHKPVIIASHWTLSYALVSISPIRDLPLSALAPLSSSWLVLVCLFFSSQSILKQLFVFFSMGILKIWLSHCNLCFLISYFYCLFFCTVPPSLVNMEAIDHFIFFLLDSGTHNYTKEWP